MTDEGVPAEEAAFLDALAALNSAYADSIHAVDSIGDSVAAFERATELSGVLQDLAKSAANLRASTALRVAESEGLSLAALAGRIGTSKARADQLIRAAKALREATSPDGGEAP
ncbi:hypothetical protein [Dactylosporangium sp. NPDC000521]|uniref:hypothetical protein n=1 Tax=Dactylosporangium sp. NPDC000521 TaxID=3363975 RepID=UPI0036B70637